MSTRYSYLGEKTSEYRDAKTNMLTEVLLGMVQIRFWTLERHWKDRIMVSREKELKKLRERSLIKRLVSLGDELGPLILSSVAFFIYVGQNGRHITASVIFTSLGLFDQVQEILSLLPDFWMSGSDARISAKRLEKYLNQADKNGLRREATASTVTFKHVVLEWPRVVQEIAAPENTPTHRQVTPFRLQDISLEFPEGALSVISGKVGSGKSLLLAAILGEAKVVEGEICAPASESSPTTVVEDDMP